MTKEPTTVPLTLDVDPEQLRDDVNLVIGYANLYARKHVSQSSDDMITFLNFHDALGRIYNHLEGVKLAATRAKRGEPGATKGGTSKARAALRKTVESAPDPDDYVSTLGGETAFEEASFMADYRTWRRGALRQLAAGKRKP